MAAVTTQITHSKANDQIRPLNPRRDLSHVANLIELCFSETLDPDGQRYLKRMHQVGQANKGKWFDLSPFNINMTSEGFVWQENLEIIGNISLIPFASPGYPIYLIANVAVHPDHRQKGIAHALTETALKWTEKRRIRSVWLQVREDNSLALRLYENAGFTTKACRTTWTLLPGNFKDLAPSGARIVQNDPRFWKSQRKWLHQNYPEELFWYWPISPSAFRPGIWGSLVRLYYETQMRQWGVELEGQLRGILSWKSTGTYADQLWLAAAPESEEIVLGTLLPNIEWRARAQRPLSLDFPQGQAVDVFSRAGFTQDHTLIWMKR